MIRGRISDRLKDKLKSLIALIIGAFLITLLMLLILNIVYQFLPKNLQELIVIANSRDWKTGLALASAYFNNLGSNKDCWFIIIQIFQSFFAPIPGQVICFFGGVVFDFEKGLFLSIIGMSIGSFLAMLVSRFLKEKIINKFLPRKIKVRYSFLLENESINQFFLIFLLPALPDDAVCFIGGLTNIRLTKLLLVSIVGRLPGVAMAVFAGANLNHNIIYTQIVVAIGAIISLVVWLFDKEVKLLIKNAIRRN